MAIFVEFRKVLRCFDPRFWLSPVIRPCVHFLSGPPQASASHDGS